MTSTTSKKRKLVAVSSSVDNTTEKHLVLGEEGSNSGACEVESVLIRNDEAKVLGTEDKVFSDDNDRVIVDSLPVYVDVASQTAYYLSVRVVPPYSEYVHRLQAGTEEQQHEGFSSSSSSLHNRAASSTLGEETAGNSTNRTSAWTVRVGDTVIVHTDSAPLPSTSNTNNSKYAWFPFTVSWSPAEVVSISRRFSRPEAIELRKKIAPRDEAVEKPSLTDYDDGEEPTCEYLPVGGGEIMMEVRWLYRISEVPIVTTVASSNRHEEDDIVVHNSSYEEVFETDHVDQCSTLCLLAPLELKSPQQQMEQPDANTKQQLGTDLLFDIPKVIFSCYRFWSVRRRCLVPVGTLLSRAARGRLHSREIQRNHALKLAIETALLRKGRLKETDDYVLQQQQQTSSPTINGSSSNNISIDRLTTITTTSSKQLLVEAASTFALAAAALDAHSLGIPLRGRENEQRRIANFLRLAIRSGNNGRSNCTMFIAGPPGTGKTSSVKCVIAQLVEEQAKGLLPEFTFVYINCMELRDPFDAYVSLWEGIRGEKRTASAAVDLLERHFVSESAQNAHLRKTGKNTTVVVLLDEIDYLTTNKQTVLYNFFHWPLKSEGLVVLGISNTINLPERLHPRVQSRLGAERCIFQSYKVQEVVDILSFRLSRGKNGPCDVAFDRDAITFAARKTAVFTGDIRKAFQLCRVAAESVIADIQVGKRSAAEEGKGGEAVRIPDIQRAARDLLDSPLLKAVATCTSFEALVLVSLAALRWSSGRDDGRCRVQDLHVKMRGVADSVGNPQYLPVPTLNELFEMLNRMGEGRYLTLSTMKMTRIWSVQLNIANDELKMALNNSPHQELAQKHLKSFLI